MNDTIIPHDDLSQFIERLKPVKDFLEQNAYIKDTTKKLKRIIEDSNTNPTLLIIGKERVGKTSIINSILEREILSSSTQNPTKVNTFIKYGVKENIKAVFYDGMVVNFDLTKLPLLTTDDSISAQIIREHIDYIEIYLNNELLKDLTLVDSIALERDQSGGAYFSQLIIERSDELLWVIRAGSPATEAEITLLQKYAERGIRPTIIVNAKDTFEGNIQQFIDSEKARYGQFVASFIAISSYQALEGAKTNNAQALIDSNFVQFLQIIETLKNGVSDKSQKTLVRFIEWLQLFNLELQFIPTREPYLSVVESIERIKAEQMIESTQDDRDREILNAYCDEYKEVSEVFHSVQTLYQLLQKLTSTFYLRDEEIEQFEELAFMYQQNVRDYRKLHTEYTQAYNRLESLYKKAFGKELSNWTQERSNDQITAQVHNIKKSYRELNDLYNAIKSRETLLLNIFYHTQNHLTELAKKRLQVILQQVSELNIQRKVQMNHLRSYKNKLQEYQCIEEAQRFLIEAVKPFILGDVFKEEESLKEKIALLFDDIEQQSLRITEVQNKAVLEKELVEKIEVDFETDYPLKPLSLTEADILSDIPPLPNTL